MKKFLLPIATLALTAFSSMADSHTFDFEGDGDLYGLTRQTKKDGESYVQEVKFSEAGIDFSLVATSETKCGFALINAGGANIGLGICGTIMPMAMSPAVNLTLTVPNGKISEVKLLMSGSGLVSLDIPFNGNDVESVSEGSLYSWTWKDGEGSEAVSAKWPGAYMTRYIHSIEVTYTRDLGGKQECGLAFSESSAEVVMGEENTFPELSNPNDLPLTWTSSDEKVATVDAEGKVTLLSGGKTTITVATKGNDSYASGNAVYELVVIPAAANLIQMKEVAPKMGDRVKVNFPATVTFANSSFAFVLDTEGNAGYIENIKNQGSTDTSAAPTIYKVGDIIPEGWIATNGHQYETLWQGIPDEVVETTEVTYPEVTKVTPEDVYRVVVLKDVTFTSSTPSGSTPVNGTTPNEDTYRFEDNYNVPVQPAGTYNVTGVVRYSVVGSTVYFYINPISYEEDITVAVEELEAAEGASRYFNLQGMEVENPKSGIFVKVNNGKASKVMIK